MSEDVWEYQINTIQGLIDYLDGRLAECADWERGHLQAQRDQQARSLAWVKDKAKKHRSSEWL